MKSLFKLCIALSLVVTGCKKTTEFKGVAGEPVPTVMQNTGVTTAVSTTAVVDTSFQKSLPSYAVSKGHFAVWTEPVDPAPRQDYTIVIAVDLPPGTTQYDRTDLNGQVLGTDGFRHNVGSTVGLKSEKFVFEQGDARLYIHIPGGDFKVRDSIVIRSTLLSETQDLNIVF